MTEEKSDEQQVKEQRKNAKTERLQELADIQAVMVLPQGRRLIHRVLVKAGIHRISYTGNSQGTAFNEGQRNIGLFIQAEISAESENLYFQMMKENKTKE